MLLFLFGSKIEKACQNRNAKIAPFLTVLIVVNQVEAKSLLERQKLLPLQIGPHNCEKIT